MKIDWKGVMPAVTTKFTTDDKLDLPLFRKNIEAQLEAGVHGIILGGTLGEASTLRPDEKSTLLETTLEVVSERIPVIINIAESSTAEAVDSAQKAEKEGANALMMLPPMRYKSTDRETVAYFQAVAQCTSLPIMVYNNPVDYKIEVTLDMFDTLLKLENIQAVKESTRDISNITRIKNRFGDRLKILCGVDTLAMESLLMGADGWVAGLVCAFPRETVAIYELIKQNRNEEALSIYRWFLPLLELDINPQLVQNIKMAEAAVGLGSETVRPPRLPLEGPEKERVQHIIDSALKARPELPDYRYIRS
ncbi:dihydrodipicolinate synthase family protein [Robertkochia aurantiaca]|uniref:dihydrodipicolinate synthase family protein n=1 Tax=Robertkochia aurantiaca TaxID=2873700 RepID=UPI001CCE9F61|nr:dihydrodipicolinate synthase family protein [Robertkochia sp. 3YJGBD-33]